MLQPPNVIELLKEGFSSNDTKKVSEACGAIWDCSTTHEASEIIDLGMNGACELVADVLLLGMVLGDFSVVDKASGQ
jgi:hypothetical protein